METQSLNASKTMRRAIAAAAACASALLHAGAAQAALLDRDLDGDTVVDAFYDTDLDITWLRNANVYGNSMFWNTAVSLADDFSFAGYDDWRLPAALQPDATCDDQRPEGSYGYNCTGSEMGHLWYVELGNSAGGPMANNGNFQNLQSWVYWTGEHDPILNEAGAFITVDGNQFRANVLNPFYAMFVRPGDVAAVPVPEPGTFVLMLVGLTGLALTRRQRPR